MCRSSGQEVLRRGVEAQAVDVFPRAAGPLRIGVEAEWGRWDTGSRLGWSEGILRKSNEEAGKFRTKPADYLEFQFELTELGIEIG